MSITIEGIALKAGVSPGTVSRILNGKNKENRPAIARRSAHIREIAERFGYRPNVAARQMLSGRFGQVAFVTCGDSGLDWFSRLMLNGMHAGVQQMNSRLIVTEVPDVQLIDPDTVPRLFRESAVDGLLIHPTAFQSERAAQVVRFFDDQPLPNVWLNVKAPSRAVHPDDFGGGALIARQLIAAGHSRIGFFIRPQSIHRHYSADDRIAGFEFSMAQAGLPAHRVTRVFNDDQQMRLPDAKSFLDRFADVTAVICYELEESLALLFAAEQMGRRVPDDLAIVGFGDDDIREKFGFKIPTMLIPSRQTGEQGAALLGKMLNEQTIDLPTIAVPYNPIAL